MGFAPSQVYDMSLWEFGAAVDGFNKAHGGEEKVEPPSEDEFYEMVARAEQIANGN